MKFDKLNLNMEYADITNLTTTVSPDGVETTGTFKIRDFPIGIYADIFKSKTEGKKVPPNDKDCKYGLSSDFHFEMFYNNNKQSALLPQVDRIIYSGNKTIVIWKDKTKTIVSCSDGETFDEFDGFTAALAKKIYGSTCAVKKEIKKHRQADK